MALQHLLKGTKATVPKGASWLTGSLLEISNFLGGEERRRSCDPVNSMMLDYLGLPSKGTGTGPGAKGTESCNGFRPKGVGTTTVLVGVRKWPSLF